MKSQRVPVYSSSFGKPSRQVSALTRECEMSGNQRISAYGAQSLARSLQTNQSQFATITTCIALLTATKTLFKFVIRPDQIKDHGPDDIRRLDILLQEVLREVENVPPQGLPESAEVKGKSTAEAMIKQIAAAIRNELHSGARR